MDIFIARQPILDRHKHLYAYEVLYRSSMDNWYPAEVESDDATHTILAHVLFNIGLDAITGSHRAMINFPENHILQKTPTLLPQQRCIVEILETTLPSLDVLAACRELREMGYTLALDDFDFNAQSEQLIPSVHIVKVDFQAIDRQRLAENMQRMHSYAGVSWLAEKIENYEEFQQALDLRFDYFQGHFFNKAEVLKNKAIDTSKVLLLTLLAETCRPEIDLKKIEALIAPDVALSFKLLRYINSVFYSLARKVTSIHYALIYLGEYGVRQFVSLAATSEICEGKSSELLRLSMVRAQLCHLLGESTRTRDEASQLFLLGLFSLLDAMLDMPMAELTRTLPLTDDLKRGLNERSGPMAPYLQAVIAYEQGDFQECAAILRLLGIAPDTMIDAYFKALAWADQFDVNCR